MISGELMRGGKLIILFLLFSCGPKKVITERFYKDSTIIKEIPYRVEVTGATVSQRINIDSLVQLLQSGIKPELISRTLIKEDPESKVRLNILLDELGNLTAICEQQDQIIEVMHKEISRFVQEKETYQTKESSWQKMKDNFLAAILILIALIIIFWKKSQ